MRTSRLTAVVSVALLLGTTLAACSSSDSGGGGGGGGTVSIGISEPEFLVPSNTVESNGTQVIVALFTPLVTFDNEGKPIMAAAESVTSSDQRVWTIKLKSGWTFHNGEPVTADNYINAWNYASYGPNAQIGTNFFERIEGYDSMQSTGNAAPKAKTLTGLKKIDDQTFQVTLTKPFAEFEKVIGYNVFYPLPKAAFSADGKVTDTYQQAPIGQGPFKMKGVWNHNQNIEVEAYSNYQGTKPKVSGINFKMYQDQNTMYNDLIAGNLDVQPTIPASKIAAAQADLGDRFKKTPSSYFGFITVPDYIKAYNINIRRAISMAFDRKEITDKIFQGTYTPATSWVSPIVQGYRPDVCGQNCTYNPTMAKQLWTQAGGVPGNKISLYYNSDGGHKEWVDAVCNQLKANLGVECVGSPVAQFADLRKQARAKTLQGLLRGAWSFDYPSIEDYLTPLYGTGAPSNDSAYSNPTFDQTIAKADSSTSEADAIKEYQAAEDIVAKDMPVIPTWYRQNVYGYSTNMSNVNVDLFANVDVVTLETQ
ncbi:MAG TPA: ABC transporter substrate-binding protein [Micromonosporaceae bacterium]